MVDLSIARYVAEELADYDSGDIVKYGDGQWTVGTVLDEKTSNFMWPDAEGEEVEASEENTVYIVARGTGGSKPFPADELTSISKSKAFGEIEASNNADVLKEKAELSRRYDGKYIAEELLSAPGVDDPGVGFDTYPPSWQKADKPARIILLDAWASMGGTWEGAYSELGSKRLASAMKDEVYGTEMWRGGFGMPDK